MEITLQDKQIFTDDPYDRFAKHHDVERELWEKMYHEKFRWHKFSTQELQEYFYMKTFNEISQRAVQRWILRTMAYNAVQSLLDEGVNTVDTKHFKLKEKPSDFDLRNFVEKKYGE